MGTKARRASIGLSIERRANHLLVAIEVARAVLRASSFVDRELYLDFCDRTEVLVRNPGLGPGRESEALDILEAGFLEHWRTHKAAHIDRFWQQLHARNIAFD